MKNKPQKPSIRLLVQDEDGHDKTLMLNDTVEFISGLHPRGIPHKYREDFKYEEALHRDKDYTTIEADAGNYILSVGIKEIFTRAAKAQRNGELLVDLTKESGFEAVVTRMRAFPTSNAGVVYERLSEFFNGAAEVQPGNAFTYKEELEIYRRALLEKDPTCQKILEMKASGMKVSARPPEVVEVLTRGYDIYTSGM